jgi:hypothetical protein
VTLGEEHRRNEFQNGVQKREFGPKNDKVAGEWLKLHEEELSNLYTSHV